MIGLCGLINTLQALKIPAEAMKRENMLKKFLVFIFIVAATGNAYAIYCKDFKTHQEAQAYFEANFLASKNLDRDNDGLACECLPGAEVVENACGKENKKLENND